MNQGRFSRRVAIRGRLPATAPQAAARPRIARLRRAATRDLGALVELEQAWTRYLAFSGGPSDRRHFVSRLRQVVEAIEHAGARQACAAELAVEQPRELEFVVNLRSARAMKLELPVQLLLRADRQIT